MLLSAFNTKKILLNDTSLVFLQMKQDGEKTEETMRQFFKWSKFEQFYWISITKDKTILLAVVESKRIGSNSMCYNIFIKLCQTNHLLIMTNSEIDFEYMMFAFNSKWS